jgi:hypothetical protein
MPPRRPKNASRLFEDAALRRLYRARIARLAADIALLDKRLAEIVAGDAMLARRYALPGFLKLSYAYSGLTTTRPAAR